MKGGLPEDRNSDGFFRREILQVFDKPGTFRLEVFSGPVVIKHLYITTRPVHKTTDHTSLAKRLAAIHVILEHGLLGRPGQFRMGRWVERATYHARVGNGYARKNNQMLGFPFDDFTVTSVPN